MNTVIFEHVDNSTTELLKQLAEKWVFCGNRETRTFKGNLKATEAAELSKNKGWFTRS